MTSLKIGPFGLLPGALAILEPAPLAEWEKGAHTIFFMQRNLPWWIGGMVNMGEAQFGDDFWQVPPLDASEGLITRFAAADRKTPINAREPSLSWSHHQHALKIGDPILRRVLLRKAAREHMNTEEFLELINGATRNG